MTVTSTTSRNDYPGTGSAGPFAYGFKIFAYTDLLVTKTDADGVVSTLTYGVDFTATGAQSNSGGTITLSTALETGENLTIRRVLPLTQLINLRNQGSTFPQNLENGLDQAVMREQALDNDVRASVRLAETVDPDDFDTSLPANMSPGDAIVVNATGDGFSMGALTAAQLSAWSATHNLTLDVFTAGFTPGVTTQLTLTADPGNEDNLLVTMRISGTVRVFEHDEYSVSGTTLTFGSAIPVGTTRIEVTYLYTYQVNRVASENATYSQSGVGAAARSVRTKLREFFSVTDYGAVGDGVTDDTTAFQNALTAATGHLLTVPKGTYKITSQLSIPTGTTLRGEGRGVSSLSFSGLGANYAIVVSTCVDSHIEDLTIGGTFSIGIVITGGSRNSVRRCLLTGGTSASGVGYTGGILASASDYLVIEGNRFTGNGDSSILGSCDMVINSLGSGSTGLRIINNDCISTTVHFNILCFDVVDGHCSGNTCSGALTDATNTSGYGITFYATSHVADGSCGGIEVSDNYIHDVQGIGIYYQAVLHGTITGNTVVDAATAQDDGSLDVGCIALNASDKIAVSGNTLVSSGKSGIDMNDANTRCSIVGNVIDSAAKYGVWFRGAVNDITVTGNIVRNCLAAFVMTASAAAAGLVLTDNDIQGCTGGGTIPPIILYGASNCVIANNRIAGTTGGNQSAIQLLGVTACIVSGNSIYAPLGTGIEVSNGGRSNTVIGNTVINASSGVNNTYDGIYVASPDTLIIGNLCENTGATGQKYGIEIAGTATNSTCQGNRVRGSVTGDYTTGVGVVDGVLVGELALFQITASEVPSGAGGGTALPATPTGYIRVTINGTVRAIPYYPV